MVKQIERILSVERVEDLIAVFGALAGLFGVTAGLLALIIHLSGLTSLGVSYLAPYAKLRARSLLRPRLNREQGSAEE